MELEQALACVRAAGFRVSKTKEKKLTVAQRVPRGKSPALRNGKKNKKRKKKTLQPIWRLVICHSNSNQEVMV